MNGNMKAVITSLGLLTITLLATVAAACMKTQRLTMTDNETGPAEAGTGGKDGCTNAIYHWRTTFAPDSSETAFIFPFICYGCKYGCKKSGAKQILRRVYETLAALYELPLSLSFHGLRGVGYVSLGVPGQVWGWHRRCARRCS